MSDTYLTLDGSGEAEIRILASRFLAVARPVVDRDGAEAALAEHRRARFDASHLPFAYVLEGDEVRFSDDGEPSGTGGRPILTAIQSRGLIHVVVSVARYFGGTKLGTGGLSRAFGSAAESALGAAPVREVVRLEPVVIRFGYDDTSAVMHALARADGRSGEATYGAEVVLTAMLRPSRVADFRAGLTDATAGRIRWPSPDEAAG